MASRGGSPVARAERPRKARRWLAPALAILLVLTGLCLLLYPVASDYLNKVEQAKVSNNLRQVVQEATPEDLSAWRQQAIDYNDRLYSGAAYVIDPFDPNAPKTSDEEYLSCLNLAGDGAMGTIVIPSIGVDLPIYHGVTGEGMDHGVGHEPTHLCRWAVLRHMLFLRDIRGFPLPLSSISSISFMSETTLCFRFWVRTLPIV